MIRAEAAAPLRKKTCGRKYSKEWGAGKVSSVPTESTLDVFLKEEVAFEETRTRAIKEVVAWQLAEAMKAQSLTKSQMAMLLKTSRSQVNRLLDPASDVTLSSLQRAAVLVGRKIQIELV